MRNFFKSYLPAITLGFCLGIVGFSFTEWQFWAVLVPWVFTDTISDLL